MGNNEYTPDVKKGMELAERWEYRKAARCFEREIRRNPENYTAYINGVLILFRSGQYNKALRYANRSIEIAPAESMAHLNKERCSARLMTMMAQSGVLTRQ